MLSIVIPVFNEESCITDRKSLLALRGVGRDSEAEGVRFHGRRVTKVGPEVKHGPFWVGGRVRNPKKLPPERFGPLNKRPSDLSKGDSSSRRKSRHITSRFVVYRNDGPFALQKMSEAENRSPFIFDVLRGCHCKVSVMQHLLSSRQAVARIDLTAVRFAQRVQRRP
jgi:hypothetical protein